MKIVRQKIAGTLFSFDDRTGLYLPGDQPTAETFVYLSYALSTHGLEEHVLPAFVLDDWGREIKSLELYRWIRDNGADFPRAELFGRSINGEERQQFLREFDLGVPYPAYGYTERAAPVEQGTPVSVGLIGRPSQVGPERCRDAASYGVPFPLAAARLQWWLVPLAADPLDFKPWFVGERSPGTTD